MLVSSRVEKMPESNSGLEGIRVSVDRCFAAVLSTSGGDVLADFVLAGGLLAPRRIFQDDIPKSDLNWLYLAMVTY
jgi:hypothetical protein